VRAALVRLWARKRTCLLHWAMYALAGQNEKLSSMSRSNSAVRLIFAIILLASLSEAASAQILVIVADGVDATVGVEYPADHVFDVPDNAKLVVGDLTTKTSYWLGAPYKGTLANYIAECLGKPRSGKNCGGTDR
jgi:hypothetical protein